MFSDRKLEQYRRKHIMTDFFSPCIFIEHSPRARFVGLCQLGVARPPPGGYKHKAGTDIECSQQQVLFLSL